MSTTLASTNPRTAAIAAPARRPVPVEALPNRAGQTGPVSMKMKSTGIVNAAIGRKKW